MNIKNLVRKNILNLKPYTAARHSHINGVLLDANENSLGSVIEDEWNVQLNRYPDPYHLKIRDALSRYLGLTDRNLFIGVGSDEIIDLVVRIFCEPNKNNVIISEPTYGMYKVVCDINNVVTISVTLDKTFQPDVDKIINSINDETKIIFLCSPNNPTANSIEVNRIISLAQKFNGIILIDEAYTEFSSNTSFINEIYNHRNVIITRTFSKAWGLAGVRCGYCVADSEIIELLYKVKLPYNINKLTEYVVLKALEKTEKMKMNLETIFMEKEYLITELEKNNNINKVYHSDTNYILFECENATEVYQKLADKGIIIRDRSNQVKNALRVTVGTRVENQKFINELNNILS